MPAQTLSKIQYRQSTPHDVGGFQKYQQSLVGRACSWHSAWVTTSIQPGISRGIYVDASDLVEREDEIAWQVQFASSLDVLESIFDEITEEYEAGRTTPIGE